MGRSSTTKANSNPSTSATVSGHPVAAVTRVTGRVAVDDTSTTFRRSEAGRRWQTQHFAAALTFLAQSADETAMARARAYLEREATATLPQDGAGAGSVIEAFLADVAFGAQRRRDVVAKVMELSHLHSYDRTVLLAGALRSDFAASLLNIDDGVRELFMHEMRQLLPPATALEHSTSRLVS